MELHNETKKPLGNQEPRGYHENTTTKGKHETRTKSPMANNKIPNQNNRLRMAIRHNPKLVLGTLKCVTSKTQTTAYTQHKPNAK